MKTYLNGGLALAVALLLVVGVPGSASAHKSAAAKPLYYVALGDSLGYGVMYGQAVPDPRCASGKAPGYVCVFFRYLKQVNSSYTLRNLSVPGMDSCEMVHGYGRGSPCTRVLGVPVVPSPLDATLAFIHSHPNRVRIITLNVGANDLLPLLPLAVTDPLGIAQKVPGVLKNYQTNLETLLSELRQAAPKARIILSTQYNPLGGIGSPPLPAGLSEVATNALGALNGIADGTAALNQVTVADVAAAFDAAPGGASTLTYVPVALAQGGLVGIGNGIHANPAGYKTWARVLVRRSNLGMPLHAKVSETRVAPSSSVSVHGGTLFDSHLTVRVGSAKDVVRTYSATASLDGTFAESFKAPKGTGGVQVRVCSRGFLNVTVCRQLSFHTGG